jgi:CheY-like chemotaxis protein
VKNISDKIKLENPKLNIELTSNNNDEISYDQKIFEGIFENALEFFNAVTPSNKLTIHHYITTDNKLRISISTKSINLSKADISKIGEPFSTNFSPMKISGLKMNLLLKQIEKNYGKYKFDDNGSEFSMNFSLPISQIKLDANNLFVSNDSDNDKDKILVIESDNASTSLLNNYLSKWNYAAHIVSSGNLALSLLKEKKYVAVILNIEQENENSLELLQKIKNNKSTRNVPVIVFSVEPEKEKIYLMGSVDYLVKPINYNNLVEILTSYKLRRNSTVLCVDDDQPTLKLVKQAVQTAGFNVIADYRPEIVLDLISDKDLDLAIIDLDMPKLNGFDLIKAIKSQDKFSKLPIIIYTGKEDYQDDLQKIDGMFTDLLDKSSTSFNDLENTISAMIKSYEEPKIISESSEPPTGPKILMAEDYKHSQIIVTRLLKKSGFENIIVVENGEEALNICEKDKIDLVLMDMQMPVMNGFEATGKIRDLEGYADVPIIALTAFAMKGDREKCLEAGATDYIPKPIDSKEFIEKVKYYTQVEAQA